MATPTEPNRPHIDPAAARLAIPGGMRPDVWYVTGPEQPGTLSPRTARMLLNDHTRRGDIVIDVDDDVVFAAVAAETGRRHHALGGDRRLATLGYAAGSVDLVLVHWPRPQVEPRRLLIACTALLRGAGRLVIVAAVPARERTAHLSALTGAAHSAGLRHTRHAAVLATDSADQPHTDLLIFESEANRDE